MLELFVQAVESSAMHYNCYNCLYKQYSQVNLMLQGHYKAITLVAVLACSWLDTTTRTALGKRKDTAVFSTQSSATTWGEVMQMASQPVLIMQPTDVLGPLYAPLSISSFLELAPLLLERETEKIMKGLNPCKKIIHPFLISFIDFVACS